MSGFGIGRGRTLGAVVVAMALSTGIVGAGTLQAAAGAAKPADACGLLDAKEVRSVLGASSVSGTPKPLPATTGTATQCSWTVDGAPSALGVQLARVGKGKAKALYDATGSPSEAPGQVGGLGKAAKFGTVIGLVVLVDGSSVLRVAPPNTGTPPERERRAILLARDALPRVTGAKKPAKTRSVGTATGATGATGSPSAGSASAAGTETLTGTFEGRWVQYHEDSTGRDYSIECMFVVTASGRRQFEGPATVVNTDTGDLYLNLGSGNPDPETDPGFADDPAIVKTGDPITVRAKPETSTTTDSGSVAQRACGGESTTLVFAETSDVTKR